MADDVHKRTEQVEPLRWDMARRAWRGRRYVGRAIDLGGGRHERWEAVLGDVAPNIIGPSVTLKAAKKAAENVG